MVQVVRRVDIPSIDSVVVDGIEYHLGILKDFRKNDKLLNFLPPESSLSISWVHLDTDEVLHIHTHPTKSMIIVCQGDGLCFGDLESPLTEGDILIVPPLHQHGFKGAGDKGFWALSIQFDSRSLYEDDGDPLVTFGSQSNNEPEAKHNKEKIDTPLKGLIKKNELYKDKFAKHRIFTLLNEGYFNNEINRSRLLDYLQVWSNYFQKMLFTKSVFCDDTKFIYLAQNHLEEEFGHNNMLGERKDLEEIWDSTLEATSQWFILKMLTLDNTEKIILVHLVLESAAVVFYKRFGQLMKFSNEGAAHFKAHSVDIDDYHVKIGIDMLKDLPAKDFEKLMVIQEKGWQMFNTMFDRITELITSR